MTLAAATRLGPYEIVAPLGAGGMGEVYRAKDLRLGREVAIKVLPAEVASDAERLARFEREAKAVSALNHPHIVTLFEVGTSEHGPYLVLEKIEGRSLRELLEPGALPVKRALQLGAQIAEGLAKAHAGGIVHRDLKPENVMVSDDGFAKILDFGLAKLIHPELEAGAAAELTTLVEKTASGMIVGTLGYLSPEQAAGRPADFRSDQFALGALLYEMATGERPFRRATTPETLTAILREEPEPIRARNAALPPQLAWIVERCLAKDPNERYASTRDLARDLVDLRDHLSEIGRAEPAGETRAPSASWRARSAWAALGAVAAASIVAVALRPEASARAPVLAASSVRATIALPAELVVTGVALSPDGSTLAFSATTPAGASVLFLRPLAGAAARRLPGTDGATFPFWSPDGRQIGFFADGKLKRIAADGGPAVTICAAERGMGGSWSSNGTIVFAPSATAGLVRVAAGGGEPSPVTRLSEARRETTHRFPQFLPDGERFLYTTVKMSGSVGATDPSEPGANAIRVATLDGGLDVPIVETLSSAIYARERLLYVRDETLVAQPLDVETLRLEGAPVPIAGPFAKGIYGGYHAIAASARLLVFMSAVQVPSRLFWYDRGGRPEASIGEAAFFLAPRLSHDARQLAVDVYNPARNLVEIHLYDVASGAGRKLAFGDGNFIAPVWSPDGARLAYLSDEGAVQLHARILIRSLSGGETVPFAASADDHMPDDWSPDGAWIAYRKWAAKGRRNSELWAARLPEGRDAIAVATAGDSGNARFAPDGRWIAYESDESGRSEVYVRPFPALSGKWQVSTAGGGSPVWSRDGRELFYLDPDDRIVAVPTDDLAGIRAGVASSLFRVHPSRFSYGADLWTRFDVSPDGRRLLVNGLESDPGPATLHLIVDWRQLVDTAEVAR